MKNVNLLEEKKKLNIGNYGDRLVDYYDGVIDEALTEIADSGADASFMDRIKWLIEGSNELYVEDAVKEYFTIENFTVFEALGAGQVKQIEEDLNEHIDDIKLNYALNYLINKKGIEELNEEAYDDLVQAIDYSDTLDGIIEEMDAIAKYEVEEDD